MKDLTPWGASFLFWGTWEDGLASCCVAVAMALMLSCREKSWAESSSQADTGSACPSKEPVTQKRRWISSQSFLDHNVGIHGPKHTVSPLKSGSCHEVDEMACCKDIEMSDRPDNCLQRRTESPTYSRRGELWPYVDPCLKPGAEFLMS